VSGNGSSIYRRLPLRMRPDLEIRAQWYQGREYRVVKEPLGLNYFRLEPEEYWLLLQLDGRTSLAEIQRRFENEFRPQTISLSELQQFLATLHRNQLVIADPPGQGETLLRSAGEQRRKQWTEKLTNVLAIRFRGIDPQRLLDVVYPRVRWLFAAPALVTGCLVALAALLLIVTQFDTFLAKLPAFHDFFAARNWCWLALVLACTKILHEFGHALACKHFGGECHQMGVMLLVFMPCLYCDVSDAWLLANKWQRIAIGAAGILVELLLASIATFLWWFSEPGLLNYLCLSVMFVSSVSTVLFNANPLLRYDGYYIFADLLEIPNLRQKASRILSRKLGRLCLGLSEQHDPFLPQRHQVLFAAYSVAAAVYRWVITLSILWFLNQVFEPYRLEIVGQMIAVMAIYSLAVRPLWHAIKFFHVPGRIGQVKRLRMAASLAVLGGCVAGILWVPFPSPVFCMLELKPRDAAAVYVDVPGVLRQIEVAPNQQVHAGTRLAVLENPDLHLAMNELEGQRAALEARLESLLHQRFRDAQAAEAIAQVRESLAAIEQQLREKQKDVDRLTLTANASGTILPPPSLAKQESGEGELSTWFGSPLEMRNLGATLRESTLLCHIGDPRQFEAVLVLDQADVPRVKPGQTVEIQFESMPGTVLQSRISQVARQNLRVAPARLSNKYGGELVTQTDSQGREKPRTAAYQALAPLDDPQRLLRPGLLGQAKIHAPPETLARRIGRYFARTFHFEL